jgi:subtilisin-like proprotein convertase family protein
MSKLRLFLLTGFLAAAVAPLYGCGSECGPGTTEQDGQCVMVAEGCGEGTILSNKQCVVDTSGCGEGTMLEGEQCVPHEDTCADGTTFDSTLGVCIANTEIVCGEGTEANDEGICAPSADACGSKTTLDDEGRCIVDAAACGPGTELQATTGDCILVDEACGDGLAVGDSGQCEPTDSICATGTRFEADSGLCLPDACEEGDVLTNGVCMNPVEQAANDADLTETENNDPALGGTAEALTVNPVGEEFTFAGTIGAPTDLDGDSSIDQDVDVFEFDATAGDWFQIGVQSNGLPAPAFTVEGPNGFMRWSEISGAPQTARHIVAPEDGTYTVTVLPSLELQSPEVGPSGDEKWGYVGTLKAIDTPTPTDKDIASGTTQFDGELTDLSDNLFNITNVAQTDLITLDVNTIGEDSDAVVSVWGDSTTLHQSQAVAVGESMTFTVPSTGSAWILVDWTKANGPDVEFDLSATVTGSSTTVTVPDGATEVLTVEVNMFDKIVASQNNTAAADLDIAIKDSNGDEVAASTLSPGELLPAIAFESADHTVEVTNNSGAATDVTLSANVKKPHDLGQVPDNGTSRSNPTLQADGDFAYYKFTANAGQVIAFIHENAEGEEIDYTIYDATGAEIDSSTFVDAYSDSTFIGSDYRWNYSDTPVTWLLETEATVDLSDQIVEVHSITPTDMGTVTSSTSASLTNSNSIALELSGFHTVTFDEAMNFGGTLSPTGSEDIDFYLYDEAGDQVTYSNGGGEIVFGGYVETAGTYLVRTECDDACNGYDIDIQGVPSSEDLGTLSPDTSYTSSVIPAFDDGMVLELTFNVPAGQMIELGHDNDDADYHEMFLYDSNGTELASDTTMYPITYSSSSGAERLYHYTHTGGDFTVSFEGDFTGPSANAQVHLRTFTPTDLGSVGIGATVSDSDTTSLTEHQWYVYKVDVTEAMSYLISALPANNGEIDLAIFDTSFTELNDNIGPFSGGLVGLAGAIDTAGTYIIAAQCDAPCTGVDLSMEGVSLEDDLGTLTANATTNHTIGNFGDGQVKWLNFTVPAGQVIEISHDNDGDDDHDFELYDGDGNEIASDGFFYPTTGLSDPYYIYTYTDAGGDYRLRVEGNSTVANQVVNINLIDPANIGTLDTTNTVTTTVTDICAESQSSFHKVTFDAALSFDGTLSPDNAEDVDFFLHDLEYNPVVIAEESGGDVLFSGNAPFAGTYLIRVECDEETTGYTVTLENGVSIEENLGMLSSDASLTSSTQATFNDGNMRVYSMNVPAGQVVELSQNNVEDEGHAVRVLDSNGVEVIAEPEFWDRDDTSEPEYVYFYSENGGDYTVALEAQADVTGQELFVNTMTPGSLGPLALDGTLQHTGASALDAGKADVFLLTVSDDGLLSAATTVPNSEDTEIYLYDTDMTLVASHTTPDPADLPRAYVPAGTYLLVMEAWEATPSYTMDLSLVTGYMSSPGLAIPDNDIVTGVTDTITASTCTSITDIEVYMGITHSWRDDLDIDLISPAGTTVRLWEDTGGSSDDLIGWFPSEWTPAEPLSAFHGEDGTGTWTIRVYDDAAILTGTLDEWGLVLTCQ